MYIGDGYCDDQNNVESCGYDKGDCCGDDVQKDYCTECLCKSNNTGTEVQIGKLNLL